MPGTYLSSTLMIATAIIIPSLNAPLIDQVLETVLKQDQIDRVREILVIGRDESGLVKESHNVQ
jgi:hypothetical protein